MIERKNDIEIGSPEEYQAIRDLNLEFIESETEYTLPAIADKLESGGELDQIEKHFAAAVMRDWLRQRGGRIKGGKKGGSRSRGGGRPRKYNTQTERQQAYLERKKKAE